MKKLYAETIWQAKLKASKDPSAVKQPVVEKSQLNNQGLVDFVSILEGKFTLNELRRAKKNRKAG